MVNYTEKENSQYRVELIASVVIIPKDYQNVNPISTYSKFSLQQKKKRILKLKKILKLKLQPQ
jgi:hypothetical protein